MTVACNTVINVLGKALKASNVSFSVSNKTITIIKDGNPEVTVLPDKVPRKMLHRFLHKYGVNIEFFYHPEMIHHQTESQQ